MESDIATDSRVLLDSLNGLQKKLHSEHIVTDAALVTVTEPSLVGDNSDTSINTTQKSERDSDDEEKTTGHYENQVDIEVDLDEQLRLDNMLNLQGFHNQYELIDDPLGSGSHGEVLPCKHRESGRECAVKIIPRVPSEQTCKSNVNDRSSLEERLNRRVKKEVEVLDMARNHPYVVQLLDFFEEDQDYFLVMERLQGGDLKRAVRSLSRPVTEEEVANATAQIALALSFFHEHGIVHRDLKPENVLCSNATSLLPLKLTDFDLVSKSTNCPISFPDFSYTDNESRLALDPDWSYEPGDPWYPALLTPVGTVEYLAPEVIQVLNNQQPKYGKKCDSWGLGVIAYFLLTKDLPFEFGMCGAAECKWYDGLLCKACERLIKQVIPKGYYNENSSAWRDLSLEARDLIIKLLEPNACKRIGMKQVLRHPFIIKHAGSLVAQHFPHLGEPILNSSANIITTPDCPLVSDIHDRNSPTTSSANCNNMGMDSGLADNIAEKVNNPSTHLVPLQNSQPENILVSTSSNILLCISNASDIAPVSKSDKEISRWSYALPGQWATNIHEDFDPFAETSD